MSKNKYKVIRGGGWNVRARFARSAYRNGREPGLRDLSLGFRPISKKNLTKKRIRVTIETKEAV